MNQKKFTILCLGDSYTIGENVPIHDSFPYQTIQLLRKKGCNFYAPEIVAKTAWTSFELIEHLSGITLLENYDYVTLLIGVNNQYRNLEIEEFKKDFEWLINKALQLVGFNSNKVIVLSIPNWGVTTFAKDRDEKSITKAIESYNLICKQLAENNKTNFIDITNHSLLAKDNQQLLAADGLHYSGLAMQEWAVMLANVISKDILTEKK